MRIAILGPEGTFCDSAYQRYNRKFEKMTGEKLEPYFCATIDDIFEAVCRDEDSCEYGIAPVENMLDGYVQRTLDLLLEKNVHVVNENHVAVQFALIGNVKTKEEIRKIYVQFKANGQCRQFLNSLENAQIVTTESNMESFYKMGDEEGAAAIVPQHITDRVADKVILDNVTDAKDNRTRFLIFKKNALDAESPEIREQMEQVLTESYGEMQTLINQDVDQETDKVRIPVYIMPAVDRPGILFDILRRFYENRINLISIMSRPTKQTMGTYNFYIEIDCIKARLDMILDTIRQIQVYNDIKILGIYRE